MGDLPGPFLTDLDSRARVKGSRDPLGAQSIWTRFGRHVIGNLTTVSNSLRDFTVLLLGYYFAERVAAEEGPGSELATFLKWEQLAAFARASLNNDYAFRGTERVRAILKGGTRITLSNARAHQILSNQQIYGIWGLYSVPGAASGLVTQDPPRLTPPGLEFVERSYLPAFKEAGMPNANRLVDLLRRSDIRIDLGKGEQTIVAVVARVLKRRVLDKEREFYSFHLLEGGATDPTEGRQALLARIIARVISDREIAWEPPLIRAFAKEAKDAGTVTGESLTHYLKRIHACECVLAPAAYLFAYLQGFDGKSLDVVVRRIAETWGPGVRTINVADVRELRSEFAAVREDIADRWVSIAETLVSGDYRTAVQLLIEQNQSTMQTRGGAAWLEDRQGRLRVRVRDEQGNIPARKDLPALWRFPYFLDSLAALTLQLRAD